ncbi:ABC transporter permease subunit [Iocasia frigidifontis]|uniref:ABC transporter permease subunit n=2 Tax=Iocasia fonsfrigidae TaxID=2682810 RepID=A0A8A7KPH9_9FIRM|nr:ABC transporter permease subunit [Iocasia fonsfrigidae]
MLSASFKSDLEIQGMRPSWIPQTFTWSNYTEMNKTVPILKFFKNSLIICTGAMFIATLVSVMAAYGISRFRFYGRNLYTLIVLSTQMLPGILFIIPYFVMFNWIKALTGIPMVNTYHGMIFTYTSFAIPFATLMMRNYLDSVPQSIDEQALIDGCNRFQALFRIIIPLAKPGIAAVAIYAFIMGWGEILFATVLTNSATRTISLGLLQYISRNQAKWAQMMAACIVSSIPIIILFTIFQKHIVQGLVAGSTKG